MTTAFLVDGVRTPIGNIGGALAEARPDDLAAHAVRALLARHPSLDPSRVADVILGCANQAGEDNRNVARMSALLAGFGTSSTLPEPPHFGAIGLDSTALGSKPTVVYVQDAAGSRWPVSSTVAAWNGAEAVELRLEDCRDGKPCIRIGSGSGSADRRKAVTVKSSGPTATVRLSDVADTTSAQRRALVCRGVGLALGVPSTAKDSCVRVGGRTTPSEGDLAAADASRLS